MAKVRSLPPFISDKFFSSSGVPDGNPGARKIDLNLEIAQFYWGGMAELKSQVKEEHPDDRYDLVCDLCKVYDPSKLLHHWHQQGYMTEQQEEKWDKVLELMERNYASFEYLHKIATGEAE